ncbi:hypothetical protein Tco_1039577, partial [Tanacetum coccineum]
MVEEQENIFDDSLILRNDESNIPGTRIEPRSDKESPEVEIAKEKEVEITQEMEVEITQETPAVDITNVIIPVNVTAEDEEITDEVYELNKREKGKNVEETRNSPIRSPRIHTNLVSSDTEKLQELMRFLLRKSFDTLADHLQEVMIKSLPIMVDTHIKEQIKKQVLEQVRDQVPVYVAEGLILERQKTKEEIEMKFDNLQVPQTTCRPSTVRLRDQVDPHDDAHPEGENSAKRQKTSKYEAKWFWRVIIWTCSMEEDWQKHGMLWVFISIPQKFHDMKECMILGIESYQQKVNLTAPTISFPGVEKHKMFSIIYEPVHGIIYKNSKKEKRVMRHSEIHKFCDATLNRVLEGLKSYNNDVKYGYVQRELTNDEVEYLKLFEEEIEVRLKYRNQMRRWEMYVNGRPLGPRRERPE